MKKILLVLGLVTLTTNVSFASIDSNLKYGMKNDSVLELQEFLQDEGLLTASPTGFFGPATLKAVKAWQVSQKLPATGFVGPMTREVINTKLNAISLEADQAEIAETGTTTPVATGNAPSGSTVYYPVYVPTPMPTQTPAVSEPVTPPAPVKTEVSWSQINGIKPEPGTDTDRADLFIDQADSGDIVTITFNGETKVLTPTITGSGKHRMGYVNISTGLQPNTVYTYDVRLDRGTKYATDSGSFTTKAQ